MEVIVLAGGMGTRLRTVVADLPKPMAPVNDKPFLAYIFKWLAQYQVSKALMSVGYKAQAISDYFEQKFDNISIDYLVEEQPLGTGGAIRYALQAAEEEHVLIINADTYFPIDLDLFYAWHLENKADLSVALKRMQEFDRYGTVSLEANRIVTFNEKQYCADGLINGGIYVVKKAYILQQELPEAFSFEKEIMEKQVNDAVFLAREFSEPFIDIGVPEDYFRAASVV